LRLNDKIKVTIRVNNLANGTKIEDSIPWNNNTSGNIYKCVPYNVSASWGSYTNDKVTWIYPGGSNEADMSYLCQVKKL